jgi:hypothetical protein
MIRLEMSPVNWRLRHRPIAPPSRQPAVARRGDFAPLSWHRPVISDAIARLLDRSRASLNGGRMASGDARRTSGKQVNKDFNTEKQARTTEITEHTGIAALRAVHGRTPARSVIIPFSVDSVVLACFSVLNSCVPDFTRIVTGANDPHAQAADSPDLP